MKNIFFYLIILSAFFFTNCKKEDNQPSNNQLVIVDRNGKTTISKPLNTSITGSFDPSFNVSATSSSGNDYSFGMGTFRAYTPSQVTFNSTGYTDGIGMYIESPVTGSWTATAGTADIESKFGSALFMNEGIKSMKITFNNVQFTRSYNYQNPNQPADTIWVSGIINAKR